MAFHRTRVVVLGLFAACGPGSSTSSDASTSDGSQEDDVDPPVALCPSAGLGPRDVLLVTGGDELVVVVHADASTTEIDPHSDAAKAAEHTAMFDAAGPYVVTASTWRDASGKVTELRLFRHDGELLWSVSLPDSSSFGPRVSELGAVVYYSDPDAVLIRDGTVTPLPGFGVIERAAPLWLPVTQGAMPTSLGWMRTDTLAYVQSRVIGPEVMFDGEKLVGTSWNDDGIRVQWSGPGEPGSELFFPHTELTIGLLGGMRWNAGPFVLFSDAYDFTTLVLVDLEHETADARRVDPPAGHTTVPCGWPTILTDGSVLMPFSDGSRLRLFELPLGGEWRVTAARALSGVRGATATERGGSYVLRSVESSGPCFSDEPLGELEGTLRGNSVQVFRPDRGVVLAVEQAVAAPSAMLRTDGRCAAVVSAEDAVVVADMELDAYATIAAPTTSGIVLAGSGGSRSSFVLSRD